ncbi:hypothetical protein NM688_g179 [Phlebia brevispora]|uniref:Uncharacterized protein n=1 Tax=Phlebia brevispora TaxID=194682 RepID=A0ACC1TER4_9APHY|nr:hypothetical protein NM688_g179 [Phlebia brevispora]
MTIDSVNHHASVLSADKLRAELLKSYEEDPRLEPFVKILTAVEAPEIDYGSSEVETIIQDLKKLNQELIPEKPKKEVVIHRFFDAAHAGKYEDMEGTELAAETPGLTDKDVQEVDTAKVFSNWGKTVSFNVDHTLVVRTVAGVQKVVRWAAQQPNKPKVRVAGFRHSWADIFGQDGDIIMMFLPYDTLTKIPFVSPDPSWSSELTGKNAIQLVDSVTGQAPPADHAFCKVMAGVTNDQFREWSFENKTVCIPFNVIMVEITFGGSNAPVCHGAGFSTTTLSDLVREITYVDATGNLQTINDRTELLAASGCFGFLGIVVSLTLQVDKMSVTEMCPVKLPLPLTIPPPPGYKLPWQVKAMMFLHGIGEKQLRKAQQDFIERCEKDYYLEWFWFPYQTDCWVNTWSKRPPGPNDTSTKAYPQVDGVNGVRSQQVQATLAEVLVNCPLFKGLKGYMQAYVLGLGGMLALPDIQNPKDAIKTYTSEALHFRRGIQNFRCLDTEWEIPITTVNGHRNYEQIQRAWWDAITMIYSREDAPVRVALEMRLTGGSDVLLAPQRGNHVAGTASIEILSTLVTPKDTWASAMQQVADMWTSPELKDEHGKAMYPRQHWAKQWEGVKVRDKDIKAYLKEDAYKEAFAEFRTDFEQIVTKRGSTVEQTLGMFGNALMRDLIFN